MQLLIVYIILGLTVAYAVYFIIKFLRRKDDADDPCAGCAGCDLKEEIRKNQKAKEKLDCNKSE